MARLVPRPWLIAALVLIAAGIVISLVGDGRTADGIGFGVGGTGAILLVGLAFYAVGRSEDLDREQRPQG
jgi:hypothetical protein